MVLLKKKIFSTNNDCFVDLLCFVCHSQTIAKRVQFITTSTNNRAPEQILDRFYIIRMEFLSLKHRDQQLVKLLRPLVTGLTSIRMMQYQT